MGSVEFDLACYEAEETAHGRLEDACHDLVLRLQSVTYPVDCTGYAMEEENPFDPYQEAFPHVKFCASSLDCTPTGDREIIEKIQSWERHMKRGDLNLRYYGIYDIEEYINDINTQD